MTFIFITANSSHNNAFEVTKYGFPKNQEHMLGIPEYLWKSPVFHVFESSSKIKAQNEVGSWEHCHLLQGMNRLPDSSIKMTLFNLKIIVPHLGAFGLLKSSIFIALVLRIRLVKRMMECKMKF